MIKIPKHYILDQMSHLIHPDTYGIQFNEIQTFLAHHYLGLLINQ